MSEAKSDESALTDLLNAGHAVVKDGVVYNIAEKLWSAEEFEACMLAMDDFGVPRHDEEGKVYSLWGRAMWMYKFIKPTHEAADAFWKYWQENGETHKHGYYESTWGAINSAKSVGI